MYYPVSESPSSLCSPIDPHPTSAMPMDVGASSTGEEPLSVCWTALVLCVRVHVLVGLYSWCSIL